MKTRILLLAASVFALCTSAGVHAKEYTFKLENNTGTKIVKIEASEDGKHWGSFDIGKGLPAHGKMELVWDESTNASGCNWQVRATYSDGSKAPPAEFDFCEDDIVLEFSE